MKHYKVLPAIAIILLFFTANAFAESVKMTEDNVLEVKINPADISESGTWAFFEKSGGKDFMGWALVPGIFPEKKYQKIVFTLQEVPVAEIGACWESDSFPVSASNTFSSSVGYCYWVKSFITNEDSGIIKESAPARSDTGEKYWTIERIEKRTPSGSVQFSIQPFIYYSGKDKYYTGRRAGRFDISRVTITGLPKTGVPVTAQKINTSENTIIIPVLESQIKQDSSGEYYWDYPNHVLLKPGLFLEQKEQTIVFLRGLAPVAYFTACWHNPDNPVDAFKSWWLFGDKQIQYCYKIQTTKEMKYAYDTKTVKESKPEEKNNYTSFNPAGINWNSQKVFSAEIKAVASSYNSEDAVWLRNIRLYGFAEAPVAVSSPTVPEISAVPEPEPVEAKPKVKVTIHSPSNGSVFKVGENITFEASYESTGITPKSFFFQIGNKHDLEVSLNYIVASRDDISNKVMYKKFAFNAPGKYDVFLFATNSEPGPIIGGYLGYASIELTVNPVTSSAPSSSQPTSTPSARPISEPSPEPEPSSETNSVTETEKPESTEIVSAKITSLMDSSEFNTGDTISLRGECNTDSDSLAPLNYAFFTVTGKDFSWNAEANNTDRVIGMISRELKLEKPGTYTIYLDCFFESGKTASAETGFSVVSSPKPENPEKTMPEFTVVSVTPTLPAGYPSGQTQYWTDQSENSREFVLPSNTEAIEVELKNMGKKFLRFVSPAPGGFSEILIENKESDNAAFNEQGYDYTIGDNGYSTFTLYFIVQPINSEKKQISDYAKEQQGFIISLASGDFIEEAKTADAKQIFIEFDTTAEGTPVVPKPEASEPGKFAVLSVNEKDWPAGSEELSVDMGCLLAKDCAIVIIFSSPGEMLQISGLLSKDSGFGKDAMLLSIGDFDSIGEEETNVKDVHNRATQNTVSKKGSEYYLKINSLRFDTAGGGYEDVSVSELAEELNNISLEISSFKDGLNLRDFEKKTARINFVAPEQAVKIPVSKSILDVLSGLGQKLALNLN